MAERIRRLVADPSLAEKLGEAGYKKVMEHHTWKAVARKVHDLYRRMCENGQLRGDSRRRWPDGG
jgi:starch synthase